ncbi:uncharacterized protein N7459_003636 [Penicillium hispanicum]|uniref:uncharacterized protein n=1 Tax=Penicillium hispanicum TaxID=1080232 RepID=UPI002540C022|nr:uncharacterized protein N7459_003636 [Penicillium hispanicum]KAJ5587871.1 hypothetical protein N7459_003636 [Penicillium hispanicum]
MDCIERPFTVTVNGQTVTKADENGEAQIHASLGPEPAVFTLNQGRLECDDWYLGRSLVDDRSLLPKRVLWFKKDATGPSLIHSTTAVAADGSYKLLLAGAPLTAHDNLLWADLMQDNPPKIEISLQ